MFGLGSGIWQDKVIVREKWVRFAFADFIFDPETGELTQNNIRVRINRQIADLLLVLIRHAGQLVTRDQIREALWPERELLNYEKVITNGISRLRFILNDNPAKPQFIESIPKRGYRLMVDVRQLEPVASRMIPNEEATTDLVLADPLTLAPEALEILSVPVSSVSRERSQRPDGLSGKGLRIRQHYLRYRLAWWLAGACVIVTVAAGVTYRLVWQTENRQVAPVSLGIAPFDTSGAGADELAGSFRLDLADSLAELPQVRVMAARSLELLKTNQATFRGAAPKLGLDAILYGRFTLEGNFCRLQFELVRGKDGTHIASFQYSGPRDQLPAIRDKVQRDTFSRLRLTSPGRIADPPPPPGGTSDPDAYDLYLRARYHLSQQTQDSLRLALEEYKEATRQDPNFAKAYAGEANTYIFLWQHHVITAAESFKLATAAVQKALSLDSTSADAHGVLGAIHFFHDWDLQAGENELRVSLRLNPNQPIFHQWLAAILCDEGRFRESFHEIDEAHIEDPLWVSAYITEDLVATEGRDHARMVAASNRLIELMPESPHVRDVLANVAWADGRHAEAIATWRSMAVMEGDAARIHLEDRGLEAFRAGGVRAYAQVRLQAIQSGKNLEKHPNDFDASEWYATAGENEKALAAIRQNMAVRDPGVLQIAVQPAFNGLHRDPEFQALLHQLRLSLPNWSDQQQASR